jgi:raffinose synthase
VVRLARRLNCDRFLAAARCKLWWMTPTWGVGGDGLVNASSSTESGVPAETQFAVFELDGGATHVAAVPIICDGFRCTLSGHVNDCRNTDDSSSDDEANDDSSGRGDGDGSCILSLVAESNCERETCDGVESALVLTCADSPFKAVEAAMALASKAMNGTFRLRSCKSPPPVVDVFGWCTWDAFYHAVTPAGVEAGAFSFILAIFWQSLAIIFGI